jgi:hypothetical protein
MASSSISHYLSAGAVGRHGLTLALVLAFLVMAFTVFEQDRTIQAQKTLIRMLWSDSAELTAMKVARVQQRDEHHK